jgi:LPXTG-site transpeptidase (sortase) family protein
LPPNTSTFYNLAKLSPGDAILVDRFNKRYIYTVKQVITVPETQNQVLSDTGTHLLTLYTCSDKAETERIVVTAEPEK